MTHTKAAATGAITGILGSWVGLFIAAIVVSLVQGERQRRKGKSVPRPSSKLSVVVGGAK